MRGLPTFALVVALVVEILFRNVIFRDFMGADFFRISVGVFNP